MDEKNFILALAPMAGYTDLSFRRLCSRFCLDHSTTEMVSAKALFYGDKKTKDLMRIAPDETEVSLQLFGEDPEIIGQAIGQLMDWGANYKSIDINMGCPAPKIVKTGAGSALLLKPDLAKRIMDKAVSASNIPVSIKIRKGFEKNDRSGLVIARAAKDLGISWITVHGRCREEYYSGQADWDFIGALAEEVPLPIIGNGDIVSAEIALERKKAYPIKGISIGRGAIGRPFLFEEISYKIRGKSWQKPSMNQVLDLAIDQLRMCLEEKKERLCVLEMRKHLIAYLKGFENAKTLRGHLMGLNSAKEIEEFLRGLKT